MSMGKKTKVEKHVVVGAFIAIVVALAFVGLVGYAFAHSSGCEYGSTPCQVTGNYVCCYSPPVKHGNWCTSVGINYDGSGMYEMSLMPAAGPGARRVAFIGSLAELEYYYTPECR